MSPRDPKRLRLAASSALQRRVLDETAHEEPSPELRDRMARTLGVSAAAMGAASGTALAKTAAAATKAVAPAAGASAGTTSVLPWVTVGVLGLALAGTIVGTQVWKTPVHPTTPPTPAVIAPAPEPSAPVETAPTAPAPVVSTTQPSPSPAPLRPELPSVPSGRRMRTTAPLPDMQEQTLLVDAARDAVSSGAANRALAFLRQYQDKYPGGIFRPEAAALKIEALAQLGRGAEVRVLANRFVAEYGDGPLTERVRHVAGLAQP